MLAVLAVFAGGFLLAVYGGQALYARSPRWAQRCLSDGLVAVVAVGLIIGLVVNGGE